MFIILFFFCDLGLYWFQSFMTYRSSRIRLAKSHGSFHQSLPKSLKTNVKKMYLMTQRLFHWDESSACLRVYW